ncbi:MAG: hypothetical protein J5786_05200 [Clostridiales bacterium]|nr:hypothetical protein [Clostridiales bacterium]
MDIIRIAGGDYEYYEQLILRRDRLIKEAEAYRLDYIREFGELINKVFEAEIECISLKKSITYCAQRINRGETPDKKKLEKYLEVYMDEYYERLKDMKAQLKVSKSGTVLSPDELKEIRSIYHEIARNIHPDLSPICKEIPKLLDLFERATMAYRMNDLKLLREIKFLVDIAINEVESINMMIPDINDRIKEVEDECDRIVKEEPYTYGKLLEDFEAVMKKKEELEAQYKEYTEYAKELAGQLEKMMHGGV